MIILSNAPTVKPALAGTVSATSSPVSGGGAGYVTPGTYETSTQSGQSLSAPNSSVNIPQGGSFTLAAQTNFAHPVLSYVDASTDTPDAGITINAVLNSYFVLTGITINIDASVTPGTYTLNVSAAGSHGVPVIPCFVTVTGSSITYSFTATAQTITLGPSESVNIPITFMPAPGDTNEPTWATVGLPAGATVTYLGNALAGTLQMTLATSSSTQPGLYAFTLTSSCSDATATVTIVLIIKVLDPTPIVRTDTNGNYSLTCNDSTPTIALGSSAIVTNPGGGAPNTKIDVNGSDIARVPGQTIKIGGVAIASPTNTSSNGIELSGEQITAPGPVTVRVEGAKIATEGTIKVNGTSKAVVTAVPTTTVEVATNYPIQFTCQAPNGAATFASLTISGLPTGVTASVALNTSAAASTVTLSVAPTSTKGIYTWAWAATINNNFGPGGGIIGTGIVTGEGILTIGPAWPPPQIITPLGDVVMTTDQYAFSVTQGDSITVEVLIATGTYGEAGGGGFLTDLDWTPPTLWPESALQSWITWKAHGIQPEDEFVSGQPYDALTLTINTTLTTPPGFYTFLISSDTSNGPPSATLNIQIIDAGNENAIAPSQLTYGTLAVKGSTTRRAQSGVVVTSHKGRSVLRALTMPVNPNSPGQDMARQRHFVLTSAQASQDDTAIAAWSEANNGFPGNEVMPGIVIDGVQWQDVAKKMTPAQYQYMCNQTQMNFGGVASALPKPPAFPAQLAPGVTVPYFPAYTSASSNAVYDENYQCIGFVLSITPANEEGVYGGYASYNQAPFNLIIKSKCSTTMSVAAGTSKGFNVLGYFPSMPSWTEILAAWTAIYGTLPTSGTIYFSIQAADPVNGCTGPVITKSVSFKNGTLQGAIKPAWDQRSGGNVPQWLGPLYYQLRVTSPSNHHIETSTDTLTIAPGTTTLIYSIVRGYPAIGGGGWTAGAPYSGSITTKTSVSKTYGAFPTGATIIPSPASVTIPSGDTSDHLITWTLTLPAGVGFASNGCKLFLETTDGLTTSSLTLNINGA